MVVEVVVGIVGIGVVDSVVVWKVLVIVVVRMNSDMVGFMYCFVLL